MSHGLNSLVQELEMNNQLIRISDPVFPWNIQPMTEEQESMPDRGKAILFAKTNIFPVLVNVTGSPERDSILLKNHLEVPFPERIEAIKNKLRSVNNSFLGKKRLISLMNTALKWFPLKSKSKVACHSFVKFISQFSEITEKDRIDSALIAAYSEEEKVSYLEPCTVKIIDDTTASIFFRKGSAIGQMKENNNYRLPIALVLGGDIAYYFASAMKIPDFLDIYTVAGFIRDERVKLAKCMSQNVYVPGDSDIVIEGFIQKNDGKFHMTCVCHSQNAIYPESFSNNAITEILKNAGIATGV